MNDKVGMNSGNETVVIARYFSLHEAEFVAAALRSEGITCFIANSSSSVALGMENSPVRLHVDALQVEDARTVLEKLTSAEEIGTKPERVAQPNGEGRPEYESRSYPWPLVGAVLLIILFVLLRALNHT